MARTRFHRDAVPQAALQALLQVGVDIRRARLRRGITMESLAARCDCTAQTIRRLENGDPGVSIGTLILALSTMGLTENFAEMLARDPDGEAIERVRGRQRAARRGAKKSDDMDF